MLTSESFSAGNFSYYARMSVPHIFLFLLVLCNVIVLPVSFMSAVNPLLVLMVIYYWSIYRPTIIPPALCFFAGLLMDVLAGGLIGVSAIVFLTVRWIVRAQRRFLMGQPYIMIWLAFGMVSLFATLVQLVLNGFSLTNLSDLMPALSSTFVSFILFPYITLALVMIHKLLPVAPRL